MTHRGRIWAVAVPLVATTALGVVDASAAPPGGADAGAVIYWNEIAANVLAAVPPPDGGRPPAFQINMGMTQGAVYDAVNAIGPKRRRPYLLQRRVGAKASTEAAVATAAYDVVSELVATAPERAAFLGRAGLLQTLASEYAASLAAIEDGGTKRQGVVAGHAAASAMLEARANDGRFGPSQWVPNTAPGHWWPLLNAAGQQILDPTPWEGGVEPFLIESSPQFRSAPPLALASAAYAAEFNQVASLGSATSSTRTADQTYVAKWWQSAPVLSWNEVARQLIARNGLDGADSARLLALQNLGGADAAINCWNDKYHYDFWRPWNAIPRAGEDGNTATTPDPGWTALSLRRIRSIRPATTASIPRMSPRYACSSATPSKVASRSRALPPFSVPPSRECAGSTRFRSRSPSSSTPASGPACTFIMLTFRASYSG
jgi:hypothetical protein